MKIKAYSSKICVLLAILFFINPVLVTADALFSDFSSGTMSAISTQSSNDMPCHDGKDTATSSYVVEDSANEKSACCDDVCLCDDAACHPTSLIFQYNSELVFASQSNHSYAIPIYSSLSFTPTSPPPII